MYTALFLIELIHTISRDYMVILVVQNLVYASSLEHYCINMPTVRRKLQPV